MLKRRPNKHMKTLLLLSLACFLAGCTLIPTPHGTAQFWGDYTTVSLTDGPVKFTAASMRHSAVAKAHWVGAANFGSVASGAVMGLSGQAGIGGAAAVIAPIVNRPTSRPAPTPP